MIIKIPQLFVWKADSLKRTTQIDTCSDFFTRQTLHKQDNTKIMSLWFRYSLSDKIKWSNDKIENICPIYRGSLGIICPLCIDHIQLSSTQNVTDCTNAQYLFQSVVESYNSTTCCCQLSLIGQVQTYMYIMAPREHFYWQCFVQILYRNWSVIKVPQLLF